MKNRRRTRWAKKNPCMDIIIKKGMLVYPKGRRDGLLQATSDEFTNEEEWENQVEYWHPHRLKQRHTLVTAVHIRMKDGEVRQAHRKVYTYPREQLSPLSETDIERVTRISFSKEEEEPPPIDYPPGTNAGLP